MLKVLQKKEQFQHIVYSSHTYIILRTIVDEKQTIYKRDLVKKVFRDKNLFPQVNLYNDDDLDFFSFSFSNYLIHIKMEG